MKSVILAAAIAVVGMYVSSGVALAGPIERACMASDRSAANRAVCGCIQQAANQTLGGSDQRRAAKFFGNPDQAHDVWMSKNNSDDAFWDRYKIFGATAEASCSGT